MRFCFWEKNKEDTDIIVELLQNKDNICVALTGAWGVGKTYRWHNVIKPKFKKAVYVSGFGKSQLAEFKLELLDKLLRVKTRRWKICMGIFMTVILTLLIGGIVFNVTGFHDKSWFWMSLSVVGCISFGLVCYFYTPLIKYFAMKMLGVDHNNIDFKSLRAKKKHPVICFDDMERCSTDDTLQDVLGFIEDLKRMGYKILMILNPSTLQNPSWKDFKEKVIYRVINQKADKKILDSVIKKFDLDSEEIKYIETVYQNIQQFCDDKEIYEEQDISLISKHIKDNFRLIDHILVNITEIREFISGYDKLPNQTKQSILSYIGLQTMIIFLEPTNEQLYGRTDIPSSEKIGEALEVSLDIHMINTITQDKMILVEKSRRRFGSFFVTQEPDEVEKLQAIKKFLQRGEKPIFKIKFENKQSATESKANFLPYYMRSPELKTHAYDLYESIITEETPFLSLKSMIHVLKTLCWCYEYLGWTFNESDFKDIIPVIKQFIEKQQIPLDTFVSRIPQMLFIGIGPEKDTYSYKALAYIDQQFRKLGIEDFKQRITTDTFFDDFVKKYNTTDNMLYIETLATNETLQKKLFNMKTSAETYKKYIDTMHYIAHTLTHHLNATLYVATQDNIESLRQKLIQDAETITKLPGAGIIESRIKEDLISRLNGNEQ